MSENTMDKYIVPPNKLTEPLSIQQKKPVVIGVLAKHNVNGSKFPEGNQFSFVNDDLISAISDNGGTPIVIPSVNKTITYTSNELSEEIDKHNRDFYKLSHQITIDKDSMFYRLVDENESFGVNSIHTSVIDEESLDGTDLKVVARDDDGNPEVFERRNDEKKSPFIGIRFHPECLTDNREVGNIMNCIISKFIKLCRERKIEKEKAEMESLFEY